MYFYMKNNYKKILFKLKPFVLSLVFGFLLLPVLNLILPTKVCNYKRLPFYQSNSLYAATTLTEDSGDDWDDGQYSYTVQVDTWTDVNFVQLKTSFTWYNTSWGWRKPLTVTNPNTQACVDFQVYMATETVAVGLVSAGKVQSDYDDIRFTSNDGKTLLNYWIQPSTITGTLGEAKGFWVRVSSIAKAGGTAIVYMYYGNSGAEAVSNADSTMIKTSTLTCANVLDTRLAALYNMDDSMMEAELLPDGGFENWTTGTNATDWAENNTSAGVRIISSDVISNIAIESRIGSGGCLKLRAIGNDGSTDFYVSTGILVQPGGIRYYQLTFEIAYTARTQGNIQVGIWNDGGFRTSWKYAATLTGYSSPHFITIAASATATTPTWLEARIYMNDETNGTAYIDNLSLRFSSPSINDCTPNPQGGYFRTGTADTYTKPVYMPFDGGRIGDISTATVQFATGGSIGASYSAVNCQVFLPDNGTKTNLTSAITVEAWCLQRCILPASNWPNFISKSGNAYKIYAQPPTGGKDFDITGEFNINGTWQKMDSSVYTNGYRNVWYHVVMTFDDSANKMYGYVNGARYHDSTESAGALTDYEGAIKFLESDYITSNTMLDGVAIYNVAISSREVYCHYWRVKYAELSPTVSAGSEEGKYFNGGEYRSTVFWTGVDNSSMTVIWMSSVAVAGAKCGLKVRGSNTQFQEGDSSPSWDDVTGSSDTTLNAIGKYLQFSSTFSTVYATTTPKLDYVSFTYINPISTPTLQYPSTATYTNASEFDWSTETFAITYDLNVDDVITFASPVSETDIYGSSFAVTELSPPLSQNQLYYWRVRAKNSNDDYSNWSSTRSFKLDYTSSTINNIQVCTTTANQVWQSTSVWVGISTPIIRVDVGDTNYSGIRVNKNEIVPSSGCVFLMHLSGGCSDYSGYDNTGVITGATWISTPTWKYPATTEQTIYFDGSGDKIEATNTPEINTVDTVSIAFWIKGQTPNVTWGGMITKGLYTGWCINLHNTGPNLDLRVDTDGQLNQVVEIPDVLDNQWHHIVGILDNGTRKTYKDGVLATNDTYNHGTGFESDDTNLVIGYHIDGDYFRGCLDEIGIWNRALSAEEIAVMYNSCAVKYSTNNWTNTGYIASTSTVLTAGTYGRTTIDKSTATAVQFKYGSDNRIKFIIQDVAGNVTESVEYTIVVDTEIPAKPTLYYPSTATYTNATEFDWSMSSGSTGEYTYDLQIDDTINFTSLVASQADITYSSYSMSGLGLSENTLYYWRVRAKGGNYSAWSSTRSFKLDYNNPTFSNAQVSNYNGWSSTTGWVNASTPTVRINVRDENYSGLRVNKTEIVPSSGCVLLLHLNNDTTDYSGYGNDGIITEATWISTPTWKSPVTSEKTLYFDGVDDYVTVPGLTWQPTKFSVSWWLYPRTAVGWNNWIGGVNDWNTFGFHAADNGAVFCGISDGVGDRFTQDDLPAGTISVWQWQQFTFTFDNGTGKFYKNGVLLGTLAGMSNPSESWGGLNIGYSDGSTIDGCVDEVGVWDRALSAEEIAVMYNSCAVKYSSNSWTNSAIIVSTTIVATTGSDGVTTLQVASSTGVPSLKQGTNNRIKFITQDMAGNVIESDSYTINVDTLTPAIPVLFYPSTATYTNATIFDWHDSTATASPCTYNLDVDDLITFASPISNTGIVGSSYAIAGLGLAENTLYYWRVKARSASGNYSAWSSTRSFKLDYSSSTFQNIQVYNGSTWVSTTTYLNTSTPTIRVNVADNSFANGGTYSGIRVNKTEVVPSSGCVLLMHMDLVGGCSDYSGYGNTGVRQTGATWISTPTWKSTGGEESIMYFGGSEWMVVYDSPSLRVNGNQITVASWFKKRTDNSYMRIINKAVYPDHDYMIHADDTGKIQGSIMIDGSAEYTGVSPVISIQQWHHVAITYDGDIMRLYLNGVLSVATDVTNGTITETSGNLGIGASGTGGNGFKGLIDEVGIWNRALSAEEIAVMYNSCAIKYSSNAWTNSAIIVSTTIVATTGSDGTTDLQVATSSGVTTMKQGSNNRIKFLVQDKAGNVTESESYTINIDTVTPSIPVLYYPSTATYTNATVFDWSDANNVVTYELDIDDVITFPDPVSTTNIYGSSYAISGLGLDENQLYYWRVRAKSIGNYSAWSSTRSFKLDTSSSTFQNVQVCTTTTNQVWYSTTAWVNISTPIVRVDVADNSYASGGTYSGIRVNKGEMVASSGCVLLSHLELTSGTSDFSGYGNLGTKQGGLVWSSTPTWKSTGGNESILTFDGSDDYINFGSDSSLNAEKFTISLWARGQDSSASRWDVLAAKETWNDNEGWLIYRVINDDTLIFTKGGNAGIIIITDPFNDGQWHHITGTYDNADWKLYVDGKISVAKTDNTITFNSSRSLLIGNRHLNDGTGDNTDCFKGCIDEVGMWNRVLSAEEIAVMYNSCAVKYSTTAWTNTGYIASTATVLTAGTYGRTTLDKSTATAVQFKQGSDNRIKFLVQDIAGNTVESASYTINVDTLTPAIPVLFYPSTATYTNATIFDWHDSTATASPCTYDLDVDDLITFASPISNTGIVGSSYAIAGLVLAENTLYYWRVKARSASGNYSAWSSTRSFKLDYSASTFQNLAITTTTTNQVWQSNTASINISTPIIKVNVRDENYSGIRVNKTEIVPSSGCVLLLHLSGGCSDYSGYGNHGATNGPTWTSTPTWKSTGGDESMLYFDGVNTDYISVNSTPSLNMGTNDFTLSAWAKFDSLTSNRHVIVQKITGDPTDGGSMGYGYILHVHNNYTLRFTVTGGVNIYRRAEYTLTGANLTGWHFVTGRWIASSNTAKLYLDGLEIASNSYVSGTVGNIDNTNNLYIGSWNVTSWIYKGCLDEIGVWNRALTDEDVAVMYNSCAVKYTTNTWTNSAIITSTAIVATTGSDGTTALQVAVSTGIQLKHGSTNSAVKFLVGDMAGNVTESESYTIIIDTVPPASVNTFSGSGITTSSGAVRLTWVTPGDDDTTGNLTNGCQYKLRYCSTTVDAVGGQVWYSTYFSSPTGSDTIAPNLTVSTTMQHLVGDTSYYFYISYMDEAGGWGTENLLKQATAYSYDQMFSVDIDTGGVAYNFGTVALGASTMTVSATQTIGITNNGNITETFSLRCETSTANSPWYSNETSSGTNIFRLSAIFKETQPSGLSDFNVTAGADDDIIADNEWRTCTTDRYSTGDGYNGTGITINTTKNIWFRLDMPTASGTSASQNITIYIRAQSP